MKKFSNFNEELKMSEIDVLSDILDSIEMLADESFDSNEEILDEVSKLLSQIGLSFDKEEVMKAVEAGEDIELPLVDSDSEETTLEVFVDESLGKKIDGDIVLRVEIGDDEKIKPSVMIYFDDESAQELSDVEFEPVDDSEEEDDESLNEDPHKEMPYDFYGWITQNEIVDLTEIGGARTHARFPKEITDKYGIAGNHDRYDFNEISSTSFYRKNYAKGFMRWMIWNGKITFENSLFDDMTKISEKQMKLIRELYKKYEDYLPNGIRVDFINDQNFPFKNFGNFLKQYKKKIESKSTLEEDKHGFMGYDFYGWISKNEVVDLTEIDGARSHTHFSPETAEEYGFPRVKHYDDEDSVYKVFYKNNFIRWHVNKGHLTLENSMFSDKTDISEKQITLIRELYKKYEDYLPHGIRIDFRNDQNFYDPFKTFSEFLKVYRHEKNPNALVYGKTMTANEEKMENTNKKFSDLLAETEENVEELKEKEEKEEEAPEVEDEEKDEKEPEEDEDDEKDDDEDEEEESKVEKHLKKAVKEFGKELDKTDEELTDEMIDTLTMSLKMELETLFNGESEEEEEQPSMDDMGSPEEETPEGESLETLEKQDQNSDVILYEAANKNIFNVILFKPTTRLIISRLIEAGSEKSIEKIVKDEYPEFIVQAVYPVTEFMFQS